MSELDATLDHLNWGDIGQQLEVEGYAVLSDVLGAEAARSLARLTTAPSVNRETLDARELGCGEILYFGAGLPTQLEQLRTALYRHLVVIANRWCETLGVDYRYPAALDDFRMRNRKTGQTREQSHFNRLGLDGRVSLHQRIEGEHVFPLQIVALLSEPGTDFHGGEFVMTEQRPRMQSRPLVVPLELGDVAIIATAERPYKGSKGYYRVNLKHAISRVRHGERIGLEISFHNAP